MGFKRLFIGGCPRSGTGAMARLLTLDGRALITQEEGMNAWKNKLKDVDRSKLIYVGDKMPEGYLSAAAVLYGQFPDVKLIFTNRNGYDVIASYLRRPLKKKHYTEISNTALTNSIKFGEEVWKRNYIRIKNLHSILPTDVYLILRYEDNVSNIDGFLDKLSNFLKYNPVMTNPIVWNKNKKDYIPHYKPIHVDWSADIPFWKDIILNTVSDQFKEMNKEYLND